jgi:hypothetical protein
MLMLTNPRSEAIRLTLSDGSARIVGPYGLAVLAEYNRLGQRLEVISAELFDGSTITVPPPQLAPPLPSRLSAA